MDSRKHPVKASSLRLVASLVGVVCAALAAARLFLHVPTPMLVVSAGLFLVCCLVFRLAHRHLHGSLPFRITMLYLVWIGLAGSFFWVGFHIDRSRWIYYRLTGYDLSYSDEKSHLTVAPVRNFLAYNRAFCEDPDVPGHILLRRGEHVIDHTVVVPRGTHLRIEAGAVLRFHHGSSLVSYSPIVARGTASDSIVFTAADRTRKWGAVGIVGKGLSVFEHAHFDHGRHVRVNGTDFYGTLSLIGADVEIRHSRFVDLFGKDAVYVRGSHVIIEDNVFENVHKDGLDLNGGRGSVSRNRFVDCHDEGIDISLAGAVEIVDNVILDARGGSIGAEGDADVLRDRNTFGYSEDH